MKNFRDALAGVTLAAAFGLLASPASAQAFNAADPAQQRFVEGNILFLTYHETGHLVLDQLLNVDQRADRRNAEEDADDVATWLLLPDPDEPDQDEEIVAAMNGWAKSAELQSEPSQSPHYPDDAERASRIACYLYGSDPQRYQELAQTFSVAINSIDCPEEFEALHADLESWFRDHLAESGATGAAIRVSYEAAGPDLAAARSYLMQSRILEDAAEDIAQFVRLPNPVTVVARSCGAGAAEFRYDAAARRITACYEAVDWFMDNADAEVAARPARGVGDAQASGSPDLGSGGARVTRRPRPPR